MKKTRLTMAEALIRFLTQQKVRIGSEVLDLFRGVFAIFGHGNVSGLGSALYQNREMLPTYRAHNEQAMGHSAIAYAKAMNRKRMMVCTTSIGPGATNLVTASAVAYTNQLPVLFLLGDIFASRIPDPVLQQIEDFKDFTVSANDSFKPVSRFWDRITRPEQILSSLPVAMQVLRSPSGCGPVVLALPQDVQVEAYDYEESFFEEVIHDHEEHRVEPSPFQLERAIEWIRQSKRPFLIVGGGVHYSEAFLSLKNFVEKYKIPFAETQAGKSALKWDHPFNMGAIGVTGSASANRLVKKADLVLALGTRLGDFTTASHTLFHEGTRVLNINVSSMDAIKYSRYSLISDAKRALDSFLEKLDSYSSDENWFKEAYREREDWNRRVDQILASPSSMSSMSSSSSVSLSSSLTSKEKNQENEKNKKENQESLLLPSDSQVIGAVHRALPEDSIVVCAAGGLPGELHKLWRSKQEKGYHLEYGYSCMGYEIAGGLGVKLAEPDRNVVVMLGDGSYLMMNSEIATSIMMGMKLLIVLLDNQGFACIDRLQNATGNVSFNNLFMDSHSVNGELRIDFVQHARSLGAYSEKVGIFELESAVKRAVNQNKTSVVVIDTEPKKSTSEGGAWWDVPICEVSDSGRIQSAYREYQSHKMLQHKRL